MEFKDFENDYQKLLGLSVLYECGMSYDKKLSQYIKQIEKVTKRGFRITTLPNILFSFSGNDRSGYMKGRMGMGRISHCRLISEDERRELALSWTEEKAAKLIREDLFIKINTLTLKQLQQIQDIIK